MSRETKKRGRDIAKGYSPRQFAAKLRRLADCVEKGRAFSIQIDGEKVLIPADAAASVEHERAGGKEEVEFQLRWERG